MTAGALNGKHALVTGGGRGIGRAAAAALSRDGAIVTVLGRGEAALRQAVSMGAASHFVTADVTDEADITRALALVVAQAGTVSILVNNAGGAESAPFAKTDHALVMRMLTLNLVSAFVLSRALLPGMQAQKFGRIINVASTAGMKGYAYVSAYCAAKHGVVGLTRSLAQELAKSGVTVNAVCPGYTETELVAEAIRAIMAKTGRDEAAARAELAKSNPQGRMVQPDEVAAAVAFLASGAASAINGAILPVAGGEVS